MNKRGSRISGHLGFDLDRTAVKQGHQAKLNMEEHDQKPGSPEASDTQRN